MRYLPVLIQVAVLVYCLIDCIQADTDRIRNLPKVVWVMLIVFLPIVGGVAWLVAGRPQGASHSRAPWPSTATAGFPEYERPRAVAPDDDPEFLAGLRRSDTEHEKMLGDWEARLREREERLKRPEADDDAPRPGA
ncbi:PLD nuclease N-terminal domain-containing protein [Cellulomonas timonensis]|uniref:PLD nuclease N-terminal domain-containing protein n=1 Tax=Cellulomonas timonensis TaxID=1689271 RepID=UPI00082B401C|nr:PLD nuclease N-terminal domain-containing protein [Cellulomonas timonensis]